MNRLLQEGIQKIVGELDKDANKCYTLIKSPIART